MMTTRRVCESDKLVSITYLRIVTYQTHSRLMRILFFLPCICDWPDSIFILVVRLVLVLYVIYYLVYRYIYIYTKNEQKSAQRGIVFIFSTIPGPTKKDSPGRVTILLIS